MADAALPLFFDLRGIAPPAGAPVVYELAKRCVPDQFAEGFSAWSITSTSTGLRDGSNFNPSCS